jgi:hypothetical protein
MPTHRRKAATLTCGTILKLKQSEAKSPRNETLMRSELPWGFIKGVLERLNKAGTPWKNSMRLDSLISLEGVEPWEFMEKISLTLMLSVAAVVDPLSRPLKTL